MIKIDQTSFAHDPMGGNCFAACVASILEIPLTEIPGSEGKTTHDGLEEWILSIGYYFLPCAYDERSNIPGYHIIGGRSPRQEYGKPLTRHAVVGKGNEIVWDPHPSRAGLVTRDTRIIIIPMNPAVRQEQKLGPAKI